MSSQSQGHEPVAIANYFIGLSSKGLTLMQLLKLSYISHGFTLAFLDKPLADEYAEAWKFGPVFPSIYHEFKYEKPRLIKNKARWANMETRSLQEVSSSFDKDEKAIMELTHEKYGPLEGWQLSAITHAPGTPWDKAWKEGKHIRGFSIRNEEIKKHYQSLLKEANENQSQRSK